MLQTLPHFGVPAPRVLATDFSRHSVPFGWQVVDRIPHPDLNYRQKRSQLHPVAILFQIGELIAKWQAFKDEGLGIFEPSLRGGHPHYADYFVLNLERHIGFLIRHEFSSPELAQRIEKYLAGASSRLQLSCGCFVYKNLALWKILGSDSPIAAFIDFEDAIAGDPTDDLSLLAGLPSTHFL